MVLPGLRPPLARSLVLALNPLAARIRQRQRSHRTDSLGLRQTQAPVAQILSCALAMRSSTMREIEDGPRLPVTDTTGQNSAPVVLIVDDEESLHQLLRRLLEPHGFTTTHALTLSEAVHVAEQRAPDAVILDLMLAGEDSGLDFLAWFRAHPAFVDTPVLILTGHTSLSEDEEALIRRNRAYVFYKHQLMDELIGYLHRLARPRE